MDASSRRWSQTRLLIGLVGGLVGGLGLVGSCAKSPSSASIGPQGGLVTSADDGLTLVIWPGALGEFENFEIVPSEMTPDSFGQAYRVSPNVELSVDAEIILRGDLPNNLKTTRIGAIDAGDVADGDDEWKKLPNRAGAIDPKEGTVHSHDAEIALYYAMLDDGVDSDGSSSEDAGTGDPSDTGTTGVVPMTSYATDIQPIFDQNCVAMPACHGMTPSGGLTLTGDAYAMLVDAPATLPGFTRIIPGNPDGSLLLLKISGTPPADGSGGGPMPPAGLLPGVTVGLVRQWIEDGCPP